MASLIGGNDVGDSVFLVVALLLLIMGQLEPLERSIGETTQNDQYQAEDLLPRRIKVLKHSLLLFK